MQIHQVVYRDLMLAARALDRNAAFRALISSNMLIRPVVGERKTHLPHVEEFNRCLLNYLHNRSYYMPSAERASAQAIVREKFRQGAADQVAVDAAFVALKALNDRIAYARELGILEPLPSMVEASKRKHVRTLSDAKKLLKELADAQTKSSTTDAHEWRTAGSVRIAEQLSSGIFLVAHPMLNGIFSRSVIVLTEHSRRSTKGFIVNRPTKMALMKTFKVHPRIMRAFGSSKVRKGGPLRTGHAEILHGHAEYGGERIVNSNFQSPRDGDGLFLGIDLDKAAKGVETEEIKQTDVMFLNGVSSWIPGQLDSEMQRGTWVAVRAPLSIAVNADKDLWSELMARLGGEYEAFSRMPIVDEGDEFDDDDDDSEEDDLGDFGSDESDDSKRDSDRSH